MSPKIKQAILIAVGVIVGAIMMFFGGKLTLEQKAAVEKGAEVAKEVVKAVPEKAPEAEKPAPAPEAPAEEIVPVEEAPAEEAPPVAAPETE
jgi:hypothetical protein